MSGKARVLPEWRSAAEEAAILYDYGTIIPTAWLCDVMDVVKPEVGTAADFDRYRFDFLKKMDLFRKHLLTNHQMFLRNVPGQGYLVVKPSAQTGVVWDSWLRDLGAATVKAAERLANVNMEVLTPGERKENADRQAMLALVAANTKKIIRRGIDGAERRAVLPGGEKDTVSGKETGRGGVGQDAQKKRQRGTKHIPLPPL